MPRRRRIGLIAGALLATVACAMACAVPLSAVAVLATGVLVLARGAVLPSAAAVLLAVIAGGIWMRRRRMDRRRTQQAGGASNEPLPIACTLTPADLRDRAAAWRKLLGSGLLERSRVPGGIRLSAQPGAEAALLELIDLERDCCAWINFEIEGPVVTMTAAAEGEAVLTGMFLLSKMFAPAPRRAPDVTGRPLPMIQPSGSSPERTTGT